MKILWLVNVIMPELSEFLGGKPSVFGGWLSGAMTAIRADDHELVICAASHDIKRIGRYDINSTVYYLFEQTDLSGMETAFRDILVRECPDIVHIFGTEYAQSLAMVRAADNDRLLITIQGALTYLYPLTFAGIPARICRDNPVHRFLRKKNLGGNSIELQKISFTERAEYEQEAIKRARYIHGGSKWGNAVGKQLNPDCTTFDCGLILRDPFYTDLRWCQSECETHSITAIFSYPIKGFHMLLRAMPEILKRFPDAKLHAIGQKLNVRNYRGIKRLTMDLAPDYNWYIQNLLDKYRLWDHVMFDGYLDAIQMRDRLLKSNVFVVPSILENQCTALGEALMLGVPCVATKAGAMPEYVTDGESALLYDFEDLDKLTDHICRIFADRNLADRLSEQAPILPQKLYDREDNGKKLINIYRTIDHNAKEAQQ